MKRLVDNFQVYIVVILLYYINIILTLTGPSNPSCVLIKTESNNTYVKINLGELSTNGSIKYRITLGDNYKTSPSTVPSTVVFDTLLPNKEYSISVTAIGHGNMTSLSSCNKTVYTRTFPTCIFSYFYLIFIPEQFLNE